MRLDQRTADKREALNISLRFSGCWTPGGQDCEETDSLVLSSLPPFILLLLLLMQENGQQGGNRRWGFYLTAKLLPTCCSGAKLLRHAARCHRTYLHASYSPFKGNRQLYDVLCGSEGGNNLDIIRDFKYSIQKELLECSEYVPTYGESFICFAGICWNTDTCPSG